MGLSHLLKDRGLEPGGGVMQENPKHFSGQLDTSHYQNGVNAKLGKAPEGTGCLSEQLSILLTQVGLLHMKAA